MSNPVTTHISDNISHNLIFCSTIIRSSTCYTITSDSSFRSPLYTCPVLYSFCFITVIGNSLASNTFQLPNAQPASSLITWEPWFCIKSKTLLILKLIHSLICLQPPSHQVSFTYQPVSHQCPGLFIRRVPQKPEYRQQFQAQNALLFTNLHVLVNWLSFSGTWYSNLLTFHFAYYRNYQEMLYWGLPSNSASCASFSWNWDGVPTHSMVLCPEFVWVSATSEGHIVSLCSHTWLTCMIWTWDL